MPATKKKAAAKRGRPKSKKTTKTVRVVAKKSTKRVLNGHYRPKQDNEFRVPPKPKQTGAPKRAMSAYMLWAADRRPELREENPDKKMTEIAKMLGAEWKEMDKEEGSRDHKKIKKYLDAAAKAKEEYQVARAEYLQSYTYKKFKKAVKDWNEMYREEWQEQEWADKERKAEAKKKREEREARKAAEGKSAKKGKGGRPKKKKAAEEEEEEEGSEEEGSEEEDTDLEEADNKKKKGKGTKKRGKKK